MVVTRFDEDFPQYEYDTTSGTPYKNCGGSESVLKSVEIIPCDLKSGDRCVLDRGTNVTFKMSFLSEKSSKTLQAKIYGIIDYIPVPFPFPQVSKTIKYYYYLYITGDWSTKKSNNKHMHLYNNTAKCLQRH